MSKKNISLAKYLTGIIIGLILGWLSVIWCVKNPSILNNAEAQIPDPGAQRDLMHKDLMEMNKKMDELLTFLKSGQLKVTLPEADKRIRMEPNDASKKQGS